LVFASGIKRQAAWIRVCREYADEIQSADAVFFEAGRTVVFDPLSLPLIDGTLVYFVKQGP